MPSIEIDAICIWAHQWSIDTYVIDTDARAVDDFDMMVGRILEAQPTIYSHPVSIVYNDEVRSEATRRTQIWEVLTLPPRQRPFRCFVADGTRTSDVKVS